MSQEPLDSNKTGFLPCLTEHLLQWQCACFHPWAPQLLTPQRHPSGPTITSVTPTTSNHIHFNFQQSTKGTSFAASPCLIITFHCLLISWCIQRNISFADGWWAVYEWRQTGWSPNNAYVGTGRPTQRRPFLSDFMCSSLGLGWE